MSKKIGVKFKGIDDFNRPVFVSENGEHYGSLDKLFQWDMLEKDIVSQLTEEDLCYFGSTFNCEPMGDPAPYIEIIRE